eukprot:gene28147-37112_t
MQFALRRRPVRAGPRQFTIDMPLHGGQLLTHDLRHVVEALIVKATGLAGQDGHRRLEPMRQRAGPFARLAHMIVRAADFGAARLAADIAAIVGERGLGGTGVDLEDRIRRLRSDRSPKAEEARKLADRWARLAADGAPRSPAPGIGIGALLALAYPDRIAQARGAPGAFRLANGRGAQIEPHESLARREFIVAADLQGTAQNARVSLAAPLDISDIETLFASHIVEETDVRFDDASGSVRARRVRRYGKLVLAERIVDKPDQSLISAALLAAIRRKGLAALGVTAVFGALLALPALK